MSMVEVAVFQPETYVGDEENGIHRVLGEQPKICRVYYKTGGNQDHQHRDVVCGQYSSCPAREEIHNDLPVKRMRHFTTGVEYGHQEAAYYEKDIDAQKAAVQDTHLQVVDHHKQYRDATKNLNIRSIYHGNANRGPATNSQQ